MMRVFDETCVRSMVRNPETNKGDYGRLGIIGGSPCMTGAVYLCASAALRSGCGLVSVAAPPEAAAILRVKLDEAMTYTLEDAGAFLADKTAGVIGPGMGKGEKVYATVVEAIRAQKPLVIDADGLNALSAYGTKPLLEGKNIILTPHPLELARLLQCEKEAIIQNPAESARKAADQFGCICVLKMHHTYIASFNEVWLTCTGCAGMAKGGSGDVLAGAMGAHLAVYQNALYAACLAAFCCGLAGEQASALQGETAMLPSDTIAQLGRVYKRFENEFEKQNVAF